MFETPSTLKELSAALIQYMERSEYFLGIHALFDSEVVFARDVVHVNFEMPAFPVDVPAVWAWLKENLRGGTQQETFVYRLPFTVDDEDDPDMDWMIAFSGTAPMTIWLIDLAHHETTGPGERYVVLTISGKQAAKDFKVAYDGKNVRMPTDL